MFVFAALCLLAGLFPGVIIDALSPVVQGLTGARMPVQSAERWLSIVPIAESRSSYDGLLLFLFIALSASIAAFAIHRLASRAVRRVAAWDCGHPDASPATQYTAGSFAQPIRRVFGSIVFLAREEVSMPAPGDMRAAQFHVRLRDFVWDVLYAPVATAINGAADLFNRYQFLTIRQYLGLVFILLVFLLLVLAIWQ
jgi:hydrogenase-4 component B